MADTPNLTLPLIDGAQNQKHVTHNDALQVLDIVVHLAVLDRDLTTPPGAPNAGDRYIVAAGGTGDWSGQDGNIAYWDGIAWVFYAPFEGLQAWIADEDTRVVYDGAAWTSAVADHTHAISDVTGLQAALDAKADTGHGHLISDVTGLQAALDAKGGKATVNAWTAQQYFPEQTLADGANISWDLNANQVAAVTLGGNRTLDNPSNMQAGATYLLRVVTGGFTLSYGTAYQFPGGTAPSLAGTSLLTFYCDGTNMLGVGQVDFS